MPYFNEAPPAPPVVRTEDFPAFLTAYRASLPVTRKFIYLNNASVGPLSDWVVEAVNENLRLQAMGETLVQDAWFDGWRLARQRIGELLGAERSQIATFDSTSTAMHRSINALPLGQGDEVVIAADDFPSVYYAVSGPRARGADIVEATSARGDGIVRTADVLAQINSRTRLVAISWVNFMHGYRMDLESIGMACREHGAFFLVDCIQGLGALQLNPAACGIHFLAGQGAKWLASPLGSGFLWVSEELPREVVPQDLGWLGMDLDHDDYRNRNIKPRSNANRFSVGTYTMPSLYGFRRSCEVLLETGLDRAEERALGFAEQLVQAARESGIGIYSERAELPSAILSLQLDGDLSLPERLKDAGVAFSVRSGRLRLSPHWFNTDEEIARVCEMLGPRFKLDSGS